MATPTTHYPQGPDLASVLSRLTEKLDKLATMAQPDRKVASIGAMLRNAGAVDPGMTGPPTRFQNLMSGKAGAAVRMLGAGMQAGSSIRDLAASRGGSGVTGMLGGALGGISDKLMTSGNPYAMAAGAVLKLGTAAVEGVQKLQKWNHELHESNRSFAEFSASMASVMAEDDARQIQLKREQGDRRADSAKELAEAKSRLDRQTAPIEDFFANLENKVAAFGTDLVSGVLDKLGIGGDPNNAAGMRDIGHMDAVPANEWLGTIAAETNLIRSRRPDRMR